MVLCHLFELDLVFTTKSPPPHPRCTRSPFKLYQRMNFAFSTNTNVALEYRFHICVLALQMYQDVFSIYKRNYTRANLSNGFYSKPGFVRILKLSIRILKLSILILKLSNNLSMLSWNCTRFLTQFCEQYCTIF